MSRNDRGMRLSTRGLNISGYQVVKSKGSRRDEIFVLKSDTEIESYTYNPTASHGFTLNNSASAFLSEAQDYLLGDEKIMEIAGGDNGTLKVRYDNGLCLIGTRTYGGSFIMEEKTDIARITSTEEYAVAKPYKYYKSGVATAPLVPLLDGDVLAVFEGHNGDFKVTIDMAMANVFDGAIIGEVGGNMVFMQNGTKSIRTSQGKTEIQGFGTIVREKDGTEDIKMYSQIPSNSNPAVDYSVEFSPEHYQYIQNNRVDLLNGWSGVGNVGYVVDLGDYAHMTVSIESSGAGQGVADGTVTPHINDEIPYVIIDSVLKQVMGDGSLQDFSNSNLDGLALIQRIYSNNMKNEVVMDLSTVETEPFSVGGYHFGYGAGHLVDANLQNL